MPFAGCSLRSWILVYRTCQFTTFWLRLRCCAFYQLVLSSDCVLDCAFYTTAVTWFLHGSLLPHACLPVPHPGYDFCTLHTAVPTLDHTLLFYVCARFSHGSTHVRLHLRAVYLLRLRLRLVTLPACRSRTCWLRAFTYRLRLPGWLRCYGYRYRLLRLRSVWLPVAVTVGCGYVYRLPRLRVRLRLPVAGWLYAFTVRCGLPRLQHALYTAHAAVTVRLVVTVLRCVVAFSPVWIRLPLYLVYTFWLPHYAVYTVLY